MTKYKCPKCSSKDLRVVAEIACFLDQSTEEPIVSSFEGSVLYWHNDSLMLCTSCEYSAPAKTFQTK